ncbi:MAG: hypothetical protein J4G11_04920, partial [Acidimicrobiia bacterium]|nr:hypothetical protein [Acidimicrobiia bacterium]
KAVQVPAALILALNGLVVVFVVGSIQARVRLAQAAARISERADESGAAAAESDSALKRADPP